MITELRTKSRHLNRPRTSLRCSALLKARFMAWSCPALDLHAATALKRSWSAKCLSARAIGSSCLAAISACMLASMATTVGHGRPDANRRCPASRRRAAGPFNAMSGKSITVALRASSMRDATASRVFSSVRGSMPASMMLVAPVGFTDGSWSPMWLETTPHSSLR